MDTMTIFKTDGSVTKTDSLDGLDFDVIKFVITPGKLRTGEEFVADLLGRGSSEGTQVK